MPDFLVHPDVVAEASLRLGAVARDVEDCHGRLGCLIGAGANTPAAGAVDDLLAHFSQVLPQYAVAGAHLSRAVSAAARGYHETDAAIAATAATREEGAPT